MSKKSIIAITSCPVGIAHTYMAAENIEKAAKLKGLDVKVETHGSIGIENQLTAEEIKNAAGLIIAADTTIDKSRFVGKPIVQVGVQAGIREPEKLIDIILNGEAKVYESDSKAPVSINTDGNQGAGKKIYTSLMNGVSYMVPFVVTGGLLIAIALSLGGDPTAGGLQVQEGTIWSTMLTIGVTAIGLMIPVLSAFIATSIADRPGLVPGFVGGMIAANGSLYGSQANAGFLGGIIAGFLAGYIALAIKKIKVPKAVQSIMPIIIIPIVSSLIVGFLFIYVIGMPVASLFASLSAWLASMQGGSRIVLAMILGAMIAVDMGGPFNKVAFLFGVGMIAEGNYEIMGPIAVAICVPPIAMGVASFVGKNKFTKPEREAGKASFLMGLFGITEGAIPFAAADPLRVIPSIIVGSMVGSVVATLGKVGDRVAHGGPIVAVLGAVDNVFMFFISVIIGVAVAAAMLIFLKKDLREAPVNAPTIDSSSTPNNPVSSENKKDELTKLEDILSKKQIIQELKGKTKDEVIDEMIACLDNENLINSKEKFKEAIYMREEEGTTGIGMQIAIPHGKSDAVKEPAVVYGRCSDGVDWESLDGEAAKLIFMIAVPSSQQGDTHLKILQMLSRKLMDEEFRKNLLTAESKEKTFSLLKEIKQWSDYSTTLVPKQV